MLFDVRTSLFGIINQYDPTVDLKVNVDHCELWSNDFLLYLEDNLMYMYDYHSLGLWVSMTQHFTSK